MAQSVKIIPNHIIPALDGKLPSLRGRKWKDIPGYENVKQKIGKRYNHLAGALVSLTSSKFPDLIVGAILFITAPIDAFRILKFSK